MWNCYKYMYVSSTEKELNINQLVNNLFLKYILEGFLP